MFAYELYGTWYTPAKRSQQEMANINFRKIRKCSHGGETHRNLLTT